MVTDMFTKTKKLTEAVQLINNLNDARFPLLLSRILQKLHSKEESFTEEEEEKLQLALSLDQQQLHLVLETISFILEQAAYNLAKPAVLSQQLQEINLQEEKVSSIVQAWVNNAKSVTEKLRQRTISPRQLTDVKWELRLQMAQASRTNLKTPLGILELEISSDKDKNNKIQFQFNHQQLYELYNKLEIIQNQLDALQK
ncbi:COMM domain-containing protein 10-like isoform X2 [Centruroides sculpturatus]|uniref:COMM domain-containing protein 10-like isoform X2 n=1 Tax=Centruroides sculpturatus TaxID=218467 RepID=UPI000C6CEACC|nr:COMM domain-containing protein 10-like isoform X2 [Centruroides sculpturatus]